MNLSQMICCLMIGCAFVHPVVAEEIVKGKEVVENKTSKVEGEQETQEKSTKPKEEKKPTQEKKETSSQEKKSEASVSTDVVVPQQPVEGGATKETLTALQKKMDEETTLLQTEEDSVKKTEEDLTKKLESLKAQAVEIPPSMLDASAKENTEATKNLEALRTQIKNVESDLEKQRTYLKEQEGKLTSLQNAKPPKKKEIAELKARVTLQADFLALQEKYLGQSKVRLPIAEKRLTLAHDWDEQLKSAYWVFQRKKSEKLLREAETLLNKEKTGLPVKQQEYTEKMATLETMKTEEIAEAFKQVGLEKDKLSVDIENLKVEAQNTQVNIENGKKTLDELTKTYESLKKFPPDATPEQIAKQKEQLAVQEKKVEGQKKMLSGDERYVEVLKNRVEVNSQLLASLTTWYNALQEVNQFRQQQNLESVIQSQVSPLLNRVVELRNKASQEQDIVQRSSLEAQIQEIDVQVLLITYSLKLQNLQLQIDQLRKATSIPINKVPQDKFLHIPGIVKNFDELLVSFSEKIEALTQLHETLKKRRETLEGDKVVAQAENSVIKLKVNLEEVLPKARETLTKLEKAYTHSQNRELFRRIELPEDMAGIKSLLGDLGTVPHRFLQQFQFTWTDMVQVSAKLTWHKWGWFIFFSILWASILLGGHFHLNKLYQKLDQVKVHILWAKSLKLVFLLLQKNFWLLLLIGVLSLLIWFIQPSLVSILFVTIVIGIGWSIKLLINLIGLLLARQEVAEGSTGHRHIHWLLVIVGALIMVAVIGHLSYEKYELNTPALLRSWLDRLFMISLFLILFPTMHIRNVLLESFSGYLKGYWRWLTPLMSWLIPISFLVIAGLGLLGYVNLTWMVIKYVSFLLLILALWIIAEGGLEVWSSFLKGWALAHHRHGELLAQDIIPLGHNVLALALVGIAIVVFLWFLGWYSEGVENAAIKQGIEKFFSAPLFKVGGNGVSFGDLLLGGFILWIVFWFGGWSRRVTHNWAYAGVTDAGVRHSLSVFTQYVIVIIGLFIALQVAGISLTAFTVVIGALSVGLGFGLQNVVNNLVSGILLLIERPLRSGDRVIIGDKYEGFVTKIGIRSLVIRTYDHTEVFVPNADVISNAFTNITHSNKFKRTTLYIRISYNSDPHQVLEVLLGALKKVPGIVSRPMYEVNMWELAEYSINFRVDYFVDLGNSDIVLVRTKVLLTIWDDLKRAGIKIPYPHQELELRTVEGNLE